MVFCEVGKNEKSFWVVHQKSCYIRCVGDLHLHIKTAHHKVTQIMLWATLPVIVKNF